MEYTRRLVGVPGVEPGTSSLSGTRSNQLSYTPGCVGGGNGIRTRDFQLAKLALYQLSYAPVVFRPRDPQAQFASDAYPFSNIHVPLPSKQKWCGKHVQPVSRRSFFVAPVKPGLIAPLRADDCPYPPKKGPKPSLRGILLRKEVIQPLVPQRLPCYDFIPVTNRTLGVYLPCGSNQRLRVQSAPMM